MARLLPAAGALLLVGLLTGCEVVVSNGFNQQAPAINGGLVVWQDERAAESGDGTDVYLRDMSTTPRGTEQLLAGGRGDQGSPAVSAQYIVWVDGTDINGRLRAGGTNFSVVRAAGDQYDPAICGSLVVWTDLRNGNPDIYGRNLPGGSDFPIAATAAPEAYPDCDGSRVVYMRTDAVTGADIALYDVATGQTTPVSVEAGNALRPAISGDRVVWQAWPTQPNANQGFDIFGLNLATGERFDVSTGASHQTAPDIDGTVVVWEDGRNGTPDIWYRDLAGGTEASLGALDGQTLSRFNPRQAPQIAGRRVVGEELVNGSWDIYLRDIP
jgi:beta propeller repeat protein